MRCATDSNAPFRGYKNVEKINAGAEALFLPLVSLNRPWHLILHPILLLRFYGDQKKGVRSRSGELVRGERQKKCELPSSLFIPSFIPSTAFFSPSFPLKMLYWDDYVQIIALNDVYTNVLLQNTFLCVHALVTLL